MRISGDLGVSGTANHSRAARRRPFFYLITLAVAGGALAAAVVSLGPGAGLAAAASAQPGGPAPGSRMALMRAAAGEFHVPVGLLLAISYGQTRWVRPGGSASVDGGYGLMDLTARTFPGRDWRGTTVRPGARTVTLTRTHYTLQEAAQLLGVPAAALRTSDRQVMDLPATPEVRPDRAQLTQLGLRPAPAASAPVDCPPALNCTFTPAAYAQNDPNDPSNYGNYDTAGRPSGMITPGGQMATMDIKYVIIHDTEGSYSSAINTFQDPASQVSAHYVIRSSDGAITEMVRPGDVSWGAGDWYVNMHAINIENEGFAAQGRTWYTRAMYQADAALVRYLAATYGIPLNRQHILGHEDVPGPTDALTAAQHWDPGPFWNWNHFMALVHRVSDATEQARGGSPIRGTHHLVTIDPTFAANTPEVTDCCATIPNQPANFVYLHTGPGGSYPLLADPLLHPGGGNGTTLDSDWGDKATTGQTLVFAGHRGNWTAIWFGGRKAWFSNPSGSNQAARYTGGTVITPRPGLASIPVYGAAYPETAAYDGTSVPVNPVVQLSYSIGAGQHYPVIGAIPADYYYAVTINSSLPDDHTLVIGKTAYYQISFNHRKFFVRAADVTVRKLT